MNICEARYSICHVAVADLWAGAEVQLKVLLSKLADKSELHLSAILFNGGRLEKEIEALGVPVTVFPETQWGSAKIFRELIHHFKRSKIDLVHTHKYKDTILAAPAARVCGISQVVRTVHGLPEPFRGRRALKMEVYESVERAVHRYCISMLIGVSSQIENRCRAQRDVRRVIRVSNGIDLGTLPTQMDRLHLREALGINTDTCLIGTVGRLSAVKGLSYLVRAVKILLDQGMKSRLLIVGDGDMRGELQAEVAALGISESVVFLGHREDTEELLQALDIFVLPSLSEGIPMALLEAMAASRPVVASRVGGIPEMIENGVEGYLVEPTDVNSLVENCRRLIEFPDVRKIMGEQGRRRVEREFSAVAMADRVASLYQELLTPVRH